jgi:LTXXQ motif family protein
VQRIEQTVKPTLEQEMVRETKSRLYRCCQSVANIVPQAPIDRFDAMGKRLDALAAAIKTVRPAVASFYASLTGERKARSNTLGPPETQIPVRAEQKTTVTSQASRICSSR